MHATPTSDLETIREAAISGDPDVVAACRSGPESGVDVAPIMREVRMEGRLLWDRGRNARIAWVVRTRKLRLDGEHRRRIYREGRARKAKEALGHG